MQDAPTALPHPVPKPGIAEMPAFGPGAATPMPADAILLNTNENRYGPSPLVLRALREYPDAAALHLYPPAHAEPLNRAIANLHGLAPEDVISGAGSELLIPLAISVFAAPGTEVIHFVDGFIKFRSYAMGAGAVPVPVSRSGDPVQAVLGAVTAATRVVLIDNPGNPTGAMLSPDAIRRIQAGLPPQVLMMLDEAYVEFSDFGDTGLDLARDTANVMVFRTFSKAYGLAGLRLGWLTAQPQLIWPLLRILPSFPISRPTMIGALAALADQGHLARVVGAIRRTRDLAAERFRGAGWRVADSHTNFLLLRPGTGPATDPALAHARLREAGILVRLLPEIDGAPALRMTIGTDADMEQVFAALAV